MDDIETQIRGTSLQLRAINRQFKWTSGRKEMKNVMRQCTDGIERWNNRDIYERNNA